MKLPIFTVDAFTNEPFKGNPAAICILNEDIPTSLMQNIAFELNLAETAFVLKEKDSESFSLRWMTPVSEVDLCGHATLASSHIMWQEGICKIDETIHFNTRSGLLKSKNNDGKITLDFPAIAQKQIKYSPELIEAIGGVKPKYVGMTKWNYIIELDREADVLNLKPNYDLMLKLPGWGTIITSKAEGEYSKQGYDFISRFFAPEKGVQEDPVTGSAHCALAPYWQQKLEKNTFKAYQASERGGTLELEIKGDRVYLTGEALTIIKGEIEV